MERNERLATFSTLAMMVFLGFYGFGLVMGVYGPGEVLYFTIPAVIFTVIVIWQFVRKRSSRDSEALTKESRHQREVRGF